MQAHCEEENGCGNQRVASDLQAPLATAGHVTSSIVLAPVLGTEYSRSGHRPNTTQDTRASTSCTWDRCCALAKIATVVLCVLFCNGPAVYLIYKMTMSFGDSVDHPLLLKLCLGLVILIVVIRQAYIKHQAKRSQEARVRHADAVRRAGEARISANSSARLGSADYLRIANGVNLTPAHRMQFQRHQLQRCGPQSLAVEPPSTIVDGVVVCEIAPRRGTPALIVLDGQEDLTTAAGDTRTMSSNVVAPLRNQS